MLFRNRIFAEMLDEIHFMIPRSEEVRIGFEELDSQFNGCGVASSYLIESLSKPARKSQRVIFGMEAPTGFFPSSTTSWALGPKLQGGVDRGVEIPEFDSIRSECIR